MAGMIRSCMQSILKMVNSIVGMVGIAMILYGLWILRAWYKQFELSAFDPSSTLWFIYSFLVAGAALCVITCWGHVAADTANGFCLVVYMMFIFLLLMMESAVTVDVLLNRDWEQDFPIDETGDLEELKDFIRNNFDICKWIGLLIVFSQGLCILFATILKAFGPDQYSDSDDEYATTRLPLRENAGHHPSSYVVGNPVFRSRNDAHYVRINDQTNR